MEQINATFCEVGQGGSLAEVLQETSGQAWHSVGASLGHLASCPSRGRHTSWCKNVTKCFLLLLIQKTTLALDKCMIGGNEHLDVEFCLHVWKPGWSYTIKWWKHMMSLCSDTDVASWHWRRQDFIHWKGGDYKGYHWDVEDKERCGPKTPKSFSAERSATGPRTTCWEWRRGMLGK